MQSHRIISALTIFLMVALVAIGYFVVAQPQLATAATAGDQLTGARAQIAASQATIIQLKKEQEKLPELKTQLASLQQSVPTDAQISSYIEGLNSLATSSGVSITGITVSAGVAYVPPVVVAAPAATTTPTPSPSPSATAAAEPPASAGPTVWTPTTDPTITGQNFVAIPVSVTLTGQSDNAHSFIKGLQSGTRLFLVSAITIAADSASPNSVTATIAGYIYVILDPTTATKSTVPATTTTTTVTATPTATPSPSGTATPTPSQSPTPTTKP